MLNSAELFLQSIEEYALVMINAEGFVQSCNRATNTITGFTYMELSGSSFSIFYTDDDKIRKRCEDDLSITLKAGKHSSETWKIKRDGTKYWCSMSLSVIMKDGLLLGYTAVLKDISGKKEEELQIRKQEERWRIMIEGVKEYSIFMLDTKGYILTWNDGGKNIKGYTSFEIIGKHFSTFYTSEDLENKKPENELKIAIATGKYEEEGWRVRKNGSLFWANVVITTLYNEYNEHIGFSKVTKDLSDKKQEEESLRQSEERYRLLVGQVKDYGIFMLDEKGRIISWNEGARKMKGYQPEEILGKYFSIFYPEEDKLNHRPDQELKIARQCGKYEEEGWRVRKDGTMFWANVVITAIYNDLGIFLGYVKVTRDLSERRDAEMALKENEARYKKLVEQLKETNESLAHANKELEDFTSIVSHDLQEPVRTIKSFLVLITKKLSEKELNVEELKAYIHKGVNATNRMRSLIQNLLQFAQLGKDEVAIEEIAVKDLVAEVLQNLKTIIDGSGAIITFATDIEIIKADRIQLMQLIENLVTNALKFVEGRAPEIKINCKNGIEMISFSVEDNGIGIASESQQRIFEIFRREPTAKKFPGTGIGLSICKKIVDRHKGKIWIESQIGKGTTFYFTLHNINGIFNRY